MRLLLCSAAVLFTACAHTPGKPPGADAIKPAANAFHLRLRWGDFRGAADLIVPERRDAFLAAREQANDERDLKITEYELDAAKLSADGLRAEVVSKMAWMRLPSVTVTERTVRTTFEWRTKTWMVVSVANGPFGDELAAEPPPVP